ncbi:MAG TPA: hypothetical protein PKO06_11100, partial [Candidatus Ozemobacteraceae bacterium]|nr:hypothetical protein [Candidatus Ozemobacteraceae bacterium]
MGRPKQHVMLAGRCFLDHILERLRAVRNWLGTVIMIGREGDDAGRQRAVDFGALWVENPHP